MKKCAECNGKMAELAGETPEGVEYKYFKCGKCGEEIVNMKQLHDVAQVYSEMRKYHAKLSKWGLSLGVRIPKELVERYQFRNDE